MSAQQLEAQSDAERLDVENTIGQLRKRLSPGQLVDEILAYTKDGGGEFLSNLGRQATNNPLPVSLIGAGLAWFLFFHGGPTPPTKASSSTSHAGAQPKEESGQDAISVVQDGIATASESVSSGIDKITGGVSSASGELAANTMGFLKDQPFILLGSGLALGAALGASLPTTDVEESIMGEASAGIKSQVKDTASEQFEKAKSAGEHLYSDLANDTKNEIGSHS